MSKSVKYCSGFFFTYIFGEESENLVKLVVLDTSEKASQWRLFFSENRLVALTRWRLQNIMRVSC